MNARFVTACSRVEELPLLTVTEIAVAGRSNCGKSSLINALTGRSKLARTSSTPGRTRQLVFFSVTLPEVPPFLLVDLPGYGYAKVSKREQDAWADLVEGYIETRSSLQALAVLNDIRRAPAGEEQDLLRWAEERDLRTLVLLTKADKLGKSKRFGARESARSALGLKRRPLAVSIYEPRSIEELRRAFATLAATAPL
jgi:GTP-binding protein